MAIRLKLIEAQTQAPQQRIMNVLFLRPVQASTVLEIVAILLDSRRLRGVLFFNGNSLSYKVIEAVIVKNSKHLVQGHKVP